MSEGTGVAYIRRTLITQLQAVTALNGVHVQYSPPKTLDEAVATDSSVNAGDIEAIYWDPTGWTSTLDLRVTKGTPHVKYQEEATCDLMVDVAAQQAVKTLADVEQRAANLVGEVVKAVQTVPSVASPGSWLHGLAVHVTGVRPEAAGLIQSAGTPVWAVAWRVTVSFFGLVEQ